MNLLGGNGFMNKRANLYLNIFELLAFLIMICSMEAYLYYNNLFIIFKILLFLIPFTSGLIFLSIELFLFLLLKKSFKGFYLIYLLIDLGVCVYLTIQVPFSGFVLFLLFCTLKNVLRIVLVNEIYFPKEFNRYCKMFGITIRDFKKSKSTRKKKEVLEIPLEKGKKVKTSKKKTTKKSVQSEATI